MAAFFLWCISIRPLLAARPARAGALPNRLAAAIAVPHRGHRTPRSAGAVWAVVILPVRLLVAPLRLA